MLYLPLLVFCHVLILLALMPYFANRLDGGILEHLFDFDELIAAAENRLFKRFCFNLNHCLHQLLPEKRNTGYMLRKRGHNFLLPVVMKALFKKSYVMNYLYKNK